MPIEKAKATPRFPRRTESPPPEAAACKRNMSSDSGSNYDSDGDMGRDKELKRAQNANFGRERPNFQNLKSEKKKNLKFSEKEKEDGEIQPANDNDAG